MTIIKLLKHSFTLQEQMHSCQQVLHKNVVFGNLGGPVITYGTLGYIAL